MDKREETGTGAGREQDGPAEGYGTMKDMQISTSHDHTQSDNDNHHHEGDQQVYKRRFLVLALFSFCTFFSALSWIIFVPLFSLLMDVSNYRTFALL